MHDNALAHWALGNQKKLAYVGFQCLDHPPYSPDLNLTDYHLFPGLKKQLKGHHFLSDTEVIAASETWLDGQPSEFFLSDLQKLEQQAKKFFWLCGEYGESILSLVIVGCFVPGRAKDLSATPRNV
jgi:histone-lysine N-methyltransferase SETMAR